MSTPYKKMTPEQKSRANANNKRWKESNSEKARQYKRTHYINNRAKYLDMERERSYIKLYGITIADYERMFKQQNGKCGICGSDSSFKGKINQNFSVDHCHVTGRVRGLLCVACNHLLGRYEKHKNAIISYLSGKLSIT